MSLSAYAHFNLTLSLDGSILDGSILLDGIMLDGSI